MNKTYIIIFVLVVMIAVAGVMAVNTDDRSEVVPGAVLSDPKNISYTIEGQEITLKNGKSEIETAPGSASKVKTEYFGNELKVDLDNDGREDTVFLLTQNSGGTGTFFYVVAALNKGNVYVGSDAYFLGDRIAPQTTNLSQNKEQKNVVVVNYAERALDEPMTAKPSVNKSAYLKLNPVSLEWGVVEPAFPGEADPEKMSLDMKTWTWVSALFADGSELLPKTADAFTVKFAPDGKFNATTDCNSMGGSFVADALTKSFAFAEMYSTEMYCEGSQETEFASLLKNTEGYHFTSKGELVFDLKNASGTATFR